MGMAPHFVLFEHAAGYGLFRLQEFEEVATFLPQVEESVTDVSKFSQVVNLIGFFPFKTAGDALSNINSVSEGIVSDDLKLFLETNMPKKGGALLGVSDSKLSASINDACGIKCTHIGVVPEVIRGIRQHFPKLVKGFSSSSSDKSQLGLSHSYSRAKVKFNVNKSDNMIIQSIALLDQLDKDINTFCMRIREWYSYHFPELIKIVPENALYAKVVKLIKNRKELSSYLQNKMALVAPNLATLIGDTVGARLISHAGSLTNLAKAPASTVQILGAEKALFRALKTRGNTPKYGLIFHSSFIGRAGAKNKGRISRYLANKCSIASRIDDFSDESASVFGSKLKEQVEDRLKFYETGDLPRKNVEVMAEAVEEAAEEIAKKKKKEKKKKKRKAEDADTTADISAMDTTAAGDTTVEEPSEEPPKKKKKKKDVDADTTADMTADTTADLTTDIADVETSQKKKKKKKDKSKEKDESVNGDVSLEEAVPVIGSEKKKKKKKAEAD